MRVSQGLVTGEQGLDERVKVWIDADRARCFQQIVLFQKLLSYLVDLVSEKKDPDSDLSTDMVDELVNLIPPTMFDDVIKKFCFFLGAAGTNKSTLDALFADGKAKIKDAMLATTGRVATSRTFMSYFFPLNIEIKK